MKRHVGNSQAGFSLPTEAPPVTTMTGKTFLFCEFAHDILQTPAPPIAGLHPHNFPAIARIYAGQRDGRRPDRSTWQSLAQFPGLIIPPTLFTGGPAPRNGFSFANARTFPPRPLNDVWVSWENVPERRKRQLQTTYEGNTHSDCSRKRKVGSRFLPVSGLNPPL